MFRLIGALTFLVAAASAVSIDNDIIGEPDIECLEDEIRVYVKTRKVFAGRIYAKGKAEQEECFKDDYAKEHTTKPRFDLRFGVCGMRSLRSVDPRGMYYGITVVVSFHPLFITKVDQAFHVKCFFEEASKGLTAELGVSMIPTTEVEARHGIPGCSYSIHRASIADLDSGKPAGPAIQFARVGDRVLHQWHCNDKMFGILVNNCYVTDGFGKKHDVIDPKGCPVDPILITGIRYSSDLQRAYAESSVFKFADKPGVWFFCQIQMCMKGSHSRCNGMTPPTCASQVGSGGGGFTEETDENFGGSSGGSSGGRGGGGDGGNTDRGSNSGGSNTNEIQETVDGDYETSVSTAPTGQHQVKTTTKSAEYGDYSENSDLSPKLHSPGSHSYNFVTPSIDYELSTEPVTVFGPAFNGDPDDTTAFPVTQTSERVSQSFETEDDLRSTTAAGPTRAHSGKNDYNDYDEVTIPPNLTDLLAQLPDDLSADSLQRMFRDQVLSGKDKKSLIESFEYLKSEMKKRNKPKPSRSHRAMKAGDLRSGDRLSQIQVEWASKRRRDVPPVTSPNDPPMIAGQLMIFDLDEEPHSPGEEVGLLQKNSESSCAISRGGLVFVAGGLGSVCAALFCVALAFYLRLTRQKVSRLSSSDISLKYAY